MAEPSEQNRREAPLLDTETMRKLEQLFIATRRARLGVNQGERKSKRRGASIEFADYRDYVQGDNLRHLDWNIYARLEALYLKEFHEQEDMTLQVLLDCSHSMAFGVPSKLLFGKRLAAALGYIALCGHDRVTVQAVSGDATRFAPARGRGSARRFFAYLESLRPGGDTDLEEACRRHVARRPARGVAVLVSDLLDERGFEQPIKKLQQGGSDVCVVHVLSPDELNPDVRGDLRLVDAETDAYVEITASPYLLEQYQKNLQGFCSSVKNFCRSRGVAYTRVSSAEALELVVLNVMRREGLLT